MSVVEPGAASPQTMVQRAKGLILTPTAEWTQIDGETPTPAQLMTRWVLPLAAIPAVASVVGGLVFGYGGFGISIRPSIGVMLASAIVSYALAVLLVPALALVIDALAATFKGERNRAKAFQVAAYAPTAGWLAGAALAIPPLSILSLAGLASLWTLYRGVAVLMRPPQDQRLPYTVVSVLAAGAVGLVASFALNAVTSPLHGIGRTAVQGEINVGGAKVEIGDLEAAMRQVEEAGRRIESGETGPAIPIERLAAALPQALPGGFTRTGSESSSVDVAAGGFSFSGASATYENGDRRIELTVADAGPMAAMAGVFGLNASTEENGEVQRIRTEAGKTIMETTSKDGSAEYAVIDGQVMVRAEGQGVALSDLRAAVDRVDARALQR